MVTVLSVLLGAIIAISITIIIENLRKPRLKLHIKAPKDKDYTRLDRPVKKMRSLCLDLENKALPWWSLWMSRNAATQAYGTITFH